MSTAYVVYRVTVAILMVAWVVADFLNEASHFYRQNYGIWLVYATNWSMLAICITAVWMAITCVYYYFRSRHYYLGIVAIIQFVTYPSSTTRSWWAYCFAQRHAVGLSSVCLDYGRVFRSWRPLTNRLELQCRGQFDCCATSHCTFSYFVRSHSDS